MKPTDISQSSSDLPAAVFGWERAQDADLTRLYERGKTGQWDASRAIDWSLAVDPEHTALPAERIPIFGSAVWQRMSERERLHIRVQWTTYLLSQILRGEQATLALVSHLCASTSSTDAKMFLATQVADEARHCEVFDRYLGEKVGDLYPIESGFHEFLWIAAKLVDFDMKLLVTSALIEGLALASFSAIHHETSDPLLKDILRRVLQDEARHVAFGSLFLRQQDTVGDVEARHREEVLVQGIRVMLKQSLGEPVWQRAGLPVKECVEFAQNGPVSSAFYGSLRRKLFPNVDRIGLSSRRIVEQLCRVSPWFHQQALAPS